MRVVTQRLQVNPSHVANLQGLDTPQSSGTPRCELLPQRVTLNSLGGCLFPLLTVYFELELISMLNSTQELEDLRDFKSRITRIQPCRS